MTDVSAGAPAKPASASTPTSAPAPALTKTAERRRYDRSIIDGPLRPAVWKIAWPTMLTNIIGGLQGIVDHILVGHLVGFRGNAAIGECPAQQRELAVTAGAILRSADDDEHTARQRLARQADDGR